jgi:hypothetical protein
MHCSFLFQCELAAAPDSMRAASFKKYALFTPI